MANASTLHKIPLVVIAGATASGKTKLGIELAKVFHGEVISCDSMQIYKNLDIGTAKPTHSEIHGIPHHMVNIVHPTEDFSVEKFCRLAEKKIKEIHMRGKLPILVGGTGLYIDNTVLATSFGAPKRDEKLSAALSAYAKEHGNQALFEILKKEDPGASLTLHPNDTKRVIRAIETVRTTGMTRKYLDKESRPLESPYNYIYMAIDMDRSTLYSRIEKRVDIMLRDGLLEEVQKYILPQMKEMSTALMAIGYREAVWYFKGLCTYGEMVSLLKRNTRRYAKRQLTWLRKNNEVIWLESENAYSHARQLIKERILTNEDTN